MIERVAEVGYINDKREQALISIYNPAVLNAGANSVQVVLSIEGAATLKAELDAFFTKHNAVLMTCPECGDSFHVGNGIKRAHAKFCGLGCRIKFKNRRNTLRRKLDAQASQQHWVPA